jgi:hypothetical protein
MSDRLLRVPSFNMNSDCMLAQRREITTAGLGIRRLSRAFQPCAARILQLPASRNSFAPLASFGAAR